MWNTEKDIKGLHKMETKRDKLCD